MTHDALNDSPLIIAGKTYQSRLLVGTGKYKDHEETKLAIPAFIAGSTLGIKLTQTLIDYELADGKKGKIKLQKFVIKNLNINGQSAFEIASTFSSLEKNNEMSLDALLVGHFDLKHFLGKEELISEMVLTIDKINHPSVSNSIGAIKTGLARYILD